MKYVNGYKKIDGNTIHKTAIIGKNVILGVGNTIMPFAVIGESGFIRDGVSKRALVNIGNNNQIGSHTSIMVGHEHEGHTIIGNNNLIMNYVNIGHNCKVGDDCEIGAGSIIGGFAKIGDQVKMKLHCTIRNRKVIGSGALIGMCSVVVSDVEVGSTIWGNPAKPK